MGDSKMYHVYCEKKIQNILYIKIVEVPTREIGILETKRIKKNYGFKDCRILGDYGETLITSISEFFSEE
jgi:hypothetical protein